MTGSGSMPRQADQENAGMEEAPDVGRVSVRSASRGDPPIVERLAVDGPAG